MASLRDIAAPIADDLAYFNGYYRQILHTPEPMLSVALRYLLRSPGKQIRPMLVFLSAGAVGTISHTTSVAAAMAELVHSASLLHDDVIDRGYTRRSLPCLSRVWGEKGAVLSGDYMLGLGLKLAVDSQQYSLLQFMNRAVQRMSTSELSQLRRSLRRQYDEAGYLEVISGKTAALFSAATQAGAASVGASEALVQRMGEYGHFLGLAFQIRDDLLDYRPSSLIGKSAANDIQEGRITLPFIHTLEQAKTPLERYGLIRLFRRAKRNLVAREKLRSAVVDAGGIDYAKQRIVSYTDQAIAVLGSLNPSPYLDSLVALANYLVNRDR